MNETRDAELDWAVHYLVLRRAPLACSTVTPEHIGAHEAVHSWAKAAVRLGDWVREDELGIGLGPAGLAHLDELSSRRHYVVDAAMPEVERRIVQGWAVRRTTAACDGFLAAVRRGLPDGYDNAARSLLEALTEAQAGMPVSSVSHAKAGADAVADWLTAARAPEPRALPLPWPKLHAHTHGLPRKKVVIVGGRSSEHKTTVARSIAAHAADKGFRVLYWTAEDATVDIAGRTIADRAGYVTTTALATGGWPNGRRPTEFDWNTFTAKVTENLEGNVGKFLRYLDTSAPRRHQVLATLRAEAARGLDAWVFDFAQLIRPDNDRTPVTPEWWRETMSLLCALAQETNTAGLLVSQIEKTGSKESGEANRLPRAIEMPFGAQLWQGSYGVIMAGFEGNKFKLRLEKWKSAEAKNGKDGQIVIPLHVEPAHDRIAEV